MGEAGRRYASRRWRVGWRLWLALTRNSPHAQTLVYAKIARAAVDCPLGTSLSSASQEHNRMSNPFFLPRHINSQECQPTARTKPSYLKIGPHSINNKLFTNITVPTRVVVIGELPCVTNRSSILVNVTDYQYHTKTSFCLT